MRLMVTFFASVPKDNPGWCGNDDSCCISDEKQRWALSDGASESYNPALWSRILVEQWVRHVAFTPRTLQKAIARYEDECNQTELSWSQQAAYERGSYATFLGLMLWRERTLSVVAVGDSIVVLMDGFRKVSSFPYRHPDDFDQRPLLVATRPADNESFWDTAHYPRMRTHWRLAEYCAPRILCMTDAIGRWFLRSLAIAPASAEALLDISIADDFEALVLESRASGEMQRDDTTLLVLDVVK